MIAATEAIRSLLIAIHGTDWASKTTEELADEPSLVARLGADRTVQLVELFRLGDRVKFADEEPEGVDDWETWVGQLLEDLTIGETSRQSSP